MKDYYSVQRRKQSTKEIKANSTDAAGEKHVPVITKNGNLVTVTVHRSPITEREWLIEFMCRDLLKLNDLRLDNTR